MEVCNTVQEAVIKTIPKEKKCKKAKWLSEEALDLQGYRCIHMLGHCLLPYCPNRLLPAMLPGDIASIPQVLLFCSFTKPSWFKFFALPLSKPNKEVSQLCFGIKSWW